MAAPDSEEMQEELSAFLEEVSEGDLSPADFSQRLGAIHGRFLGDDLNSAEHVRARQQALAAYKQLIGDIDRHHQIELIALALGIDA